MAKLREEVKSAVRFLKLTKLSSLPFSLSTHFKVEPEKYYQVDYFESQP